MLKSRITEEPIPDYLRTDPIKYPDYLTLGRVGSRLTVAFNADDEQGALDRIDHALVIRTYGLNALAIAEEEIKRQALAKPAAKK